jgi:hypothetical protein
MCHLAKPRIIANGIYDDTDAAMTTMASMYAKWPQAWAPRVSREEILTDCWETSCADFGVQLPFTHMLSVCVRA